MRDRTAHFRRDRAFSLVEVTLALGIIAFGLVAVLGVLPVALTTARVSIAQTRAAALAETVFAGLRAESFPAARPGRGLEAIGAVLPDFDLRKFGPSDAATVYAVLTEVSPPGETDPRRLRFTGDASAVPGLITAEGRAATAYRLDFQFEPQPDGMLTAGRANRVTLTVRPAVGTGDGYRFATIFADRGV